MKTKSPTLTLTELAERAHRDGRTVKRILRAAGYTPRADGRSLRYPWTQRVRALLATPPRTAGNPALRDEKLRQEILKLRIANDAVEARYVNRVAIETDLKKVEAAMRDILRIKLENEWPAKVAGLDVTQARIYGRRMHDEIMLAFQSLHTLFTV